MNKQNNRYFGQPENEIWFYDKDMPYYWLTNFYYNDESQTGSGVVGTPQYPIKCKLPLDAAHIELLSIDKNGRINKAKKAFSCLYSENSWGTFPYFPWLNPRWRENAPFHHGSPGQEIIWPTAEHLFQALKFTLWDWKDEKKIGGCAIIGCIPSALNPEYNNLNQYALAICKILEGANISISGVNWDTHKLNPADARNFANSKEVKFLVRPDWHTGYKIRAMKWVVREKFKNPELREKLWKTGTKKLVEHSPYDNFWGDGGDGNGKNMLGKILMEIREEIIAEKGECPSVIDESEISHNRDREDAENKKILIEKNIQEICAKLQIAKVSLEQENEILGDVWKIDYQINWLTSSQEQIEKAKKEVLEKISEWVTRNKGPERDGPNQDNSSENEKPDRPEDRKIPVPPSPVENDRIKSELNDASETNNSDDIFNALKNNQENIVNSADEDLQKKAKILENKLNELNKEKSVGIIKGQIKTVLEQEKIKACDLPVSIQQKYSELGNNNNNNNAIRDEIVQEVGKISANKLIVSLEQALSENNKTEIKNKEQDLRNFVDNKVSYRKQAIQDYQERINWLFREAQQKLSLNESNDNPFFRLDNPLLYGFGIAIVGAVIVLRKLRLKRV